MGTLSLFAFLQEWCLSAAACDTNGYSSPPEKQWRRWRGGKMNDGRMMALWIYLNVKTNSDSSAADLHEQVELLVFLLTSFDELQRRRLVAAERSHSALYLLLFLTTELKHIQSKSLFKEFNISVLFVKPESLHQICLNPKFKSNSKSNFAWIKKEKILTHSKRSSPIWPITDVSLLLLIAAICSVIETKIGRGH